MKPDPSTICVHAGKRPDIEGGVNTPISMSSAYAYKEQDTVLYPRYFNTANQQAAGAKIAALEQADEAILFSSGMAAISTLFLSQLQAGDHVVFSQDVYGGTEHFVRNEFPRLGLKFSFVENRLDAIKLAITPSTRMVFVESPTNPLLKIIDLAALSQLRNESAGNFMLVADNTFATPLCQQPLSLGFDLVVHSATKYLGGHSDLSAGVVAGHGHAMQRVRESACKYGGCLNALDCWLLERSIKTLAIRVERQTSNALALASRLRDHPLINHVYYPGLSGHADHALAARQMHWFGAMISFNINDTLDPSRFENKLDLIGSAVSLGGIESTICQPILTSHAKMNEIQRRSLGITSSLFRLSVGIESVNDLYRDLARSLTLAAQ